MSGTPDDAQLRRLMAVGGSTAVRSNGFEILRWIRDETDLVVEAGDENWAAVDARLGRTVIARVFPKKAGHIKVRNRTPDPDGYVGSTANAKGEWVFELDSPRFDASEVQRCIRDAL